MYICFTYVYATLRSLDNDSHGKKNMKLEKDTSTKLGCRVKVAKVGGSEGTLYIG